MKKSIEVPLLLNGKTRWKNQGKGSGGWKNTEEIHNGGNIFTHCET
jgi:hypothetical protein